jgi:hypothetical protein
MSMNVGKVIVGGLVAGLVSNVVDMTTNFTVLMPDMKFMVERLHLDPAVLQPSFAGIAPWVTIDFFTGILLVFTYAAMRPRFGAGPKTAIIAGLTLYLVVTAVLSGFLSMGVFTRGMFVRSSIAALASVLLGSLAGAAVYKEADPAGGAPASRDRAGMMAHV